MLARIYKPAKTAMQSARAKTKEWVLEYEPATRQEIEPLMGWTSSNDMLSQVRLFFETKEEAIDYAQERPAILHELRWPYHDRSPALGLGRRLCRVYSHSGVHSRRPRQLCGDGPADEGWAAQAQRFPCRIGRVRCDSVGVAPGLPVHLKVLSSEITQMNVSRLHLAFPTAFGDGGGLHPSTADAWSTPGTFRCRRLLLCRPRRSHSPVHPASALARLGEPYRAHRGKLPPGFHQLAPRFSRKSLQPRAGALRARYRDEGTEIFC
jgi:hypothetical protein